MENKAILGELAIVTEQSYSVALDLIKEVKKNHEIIVNDGKEEYDFIKKSLLKNNKLVKSSNEANKLNTKMEE